jgi:hypothetical protein
VRGDVNGLAYRRTRTPHDSDPLLALPLRLPRRTRLGLFVDAALPEAPRGGVDGGINDVRAWIVGDGQQLERNRYAQRDLEESEGKEGMYYGAHSEHAAIPSSHLVLA